MQEDKGTMSVNIDCGDEEKNQYGFETNVCREQEVISNAHNRSHDENAVDDGDDDDDDDDDDEDDDGDDDGEDEEEGEESEEVTDDEVEDGHLDGHDKRQDAKKLAGNATELQQSNDEADHTAVTSDVFVSHEPAADASHVQNGLIDIPTCDLSGSHLDMEDVLL